MVFVLLCGMLPAALAADGTLTLSPSSVDVKVGETAEVEIKDAPEGASNYNITINDDDKVDVSINGTKLSIKGKAAGPTTVTVTTSTGDDSSKSTYSGSVSVTVKEASIAVTGISLDKSSASVTVKGTTTLTATVSPDDATDKTVTWGSENESIATVDKNGIVTGVAVGETNITATAGDQSAKCKVTVTDGSTTPEDTKVDTLKIDGGDFTLSTKGTKLLYFTAKNVAGKDITSSVTGTWSSSNEKVATVSSSGKVLAIKEGDAKITVIAGGKEASVWVTVKDYDSADISVTIYDDDEEYAFGDSPSGKGKSIYDQIVAELDYSKSEIKDFYYFFDYSSSKVGSLDSDRGYMSDFDDVTFSIKRDGTFETGYEIREDKNGKTLLTGKIEIIVKEGEGSSKKGDINYTASRGSVVYFDEDDFEDYFLDKYPKGELEYVTFSRPSSGTLYYDGKKLSTSDKFCFNAGKRENDLDAVSYEPSSDTYTGTVTISFTATGEDRYGDEKDYGGVVSIAYSGADAKDINYQATNGSVRLNPDDFVSVYKTAAGVSASNPTMYIRFSKLPSSGNLYVGYTANGGGTKVSTGTYYSSKSSANNYIGDITYVPSAAGGTETVEYTAYSTDSSSGLKYTGKIVFTASAAVSTRPVNISYNCTGGSVQFSRADFSGSSDAMGMIDYLTFSAPSAGTLYVNYAGGTGTQVTSTQRFDYVGISSLGTTSVGSVSYVPPMGWSGTATVPFTAYLIGGGTVNGTVTISVTAAATTTLKDVKTTDWYATYVTDLVAAGVLTGYPDNTFQPTYNVTYAEILKLVMLATGYTEQPKTGPHWASGYLDRALADGIITAQVSPDAHASRAAVADIVARAMKLSPVTDGASPFKDSANGYARALASAGILTGYDDGYFRGDNPIQRSQIAAIIWRMMHYDGGTVTQPTNPSNPSTPSQPDTDIPDWLLS